LEGRDLAAANFSSLEMPKRILVRFSCEVPAIVGVDMKSYGPFKPEDLVVLPRNNAETLIRRGVATAVELTESEDA